MQSLKSTFVAVLLLGLSVGLYQISDPDESSIDESLIPAVDISDGSDLLVEQMIPESVSSANAVASASSLAPPALQDSPEPNQSPSLISNASPEDGSESRSSAVDVPMPSKGNVQSFDYPELSNQIQIPETESATDFRERQIFQKDRDEGLIDALETQRQLSAPALAETVGPTPRTIAPDMKSNAQNQFVSTEPVSSSVQDIGATEASASQFPDVDTQADVLPDLDSLPLNAAWAEVDRLVAETEYRDALKLLTRFYGTEEANGPQRQRLLGWLDALAGKVIFSAEHHYRDKPYIVAANDSLVDLSRKWQIPSQLIYNINRSEIPNPSSLSPGTQLKVVDRPFHANIDLKSNVMTLFTDDLYAGRYPVRIGVSGNVAAGNYRVLAKAAEGFRWRDASGAEYPPESPLNGYGPHWIGLSGSLCMHALKDGATEGHHGCIGLNPTDAVDVFQILSQASVVTIVD